MQTNKQKVALYVHVPFCKQRCKYCTFVSCCDYNLAPSYFDALCNEIATKSRQDVVLKSIFFGGGTPSSVDEIYLQKVFDTIYQNYQIDSNCEVTVECNPESLTQQRIKFFVKNGVNRLSIGLQSSNDNTLKNVGRIHTYQQFCDSVQMALSSGITNINADLILGLPENKQDFVNTLNTVVSLPITHLSIYALEVYPNSQLENEIKQGQLVVNQDEDYLANLYQLALQKLFSNGFDRYEVSNFAKNGYQCKHNLAYWQCDSYFGFGASAHGYMDGIRTENASDIAQYIAMASQNGCAVVDSNLIDVDEQMQEYVMLGLRLSQGINLQTFANKFNKTLFDAFPNVTKYLQLGVLQQDGNKLFVSPDKFYVLNEILTEIL